MKEGWETKTLADVCHFANGLWKGEKPPFATVGVIRNTNFTKDGHLDDTDIAYIDVEARKLEKRRLEFGDIILEKSGGGPKQPVGRVALFDKSDGIFSFSNFTAAMRVRDAEELDFRFLHKFLHWKYLSGVTEGIQSHSTGIRNLNGDAYKAIEISYPPLPEQQRIVALLDEAFAGLAIAKANAERNLNNAHWAYETHLQSIFNAQGKEWREATVKRIARPGKGSIRTGPFGSQLLHSEFVDEGIAVLGIDNAVNNHFRWGKDRFITPEKYEELERYTVHPGDVLITIMGTCGRCAVVPDDIPTAINTKHLCCITLDRDQCLPDYLHIYFLHAPQSQEYLAKHAKGAIMAVSTWGLFKIFRYFFRQSKCKRRSSEFPACCAKQPNVSPTSTNANSPPWKNSNNLSCSRPSTANSEPASWASRASPLGLSHRLRCCHDGLRRPPLHQTCLLYTSPSPRDGLLSRMPSSA